MKGHIDLSKVVFPEDIDGSKLDPIARMPLWSFGLDFNHGTGHGVGAFLNVHEGPQGISFRKRPNEVVIILYCLVQLVTCLLCIWFLFRASKSG
jgi:Xaa-Pro aminopeptidase